MEKLEDYEKMKLLLEQYKTVVQSSESMMQRRQTVNSFYLTINTALFTIFGAIVVSKKLDLEYASLITFGLCLLGMGTSRAWSKNSHSYGILKRSKIKLIERQLPVSLFDAEWAVMNAMYCVIR